jgi:hypothetical protein
MKESDYQWDREGEPIGDLIASAAEIPESVAENIRLILYDQHFDWESAKLMEEGPYDSDAHYTWKKPDCSEFHEEWSAFERSLNDEARFFNQIAEETLGRIFLGIEAHQTQTGQSIIVKAGPGNALSSLYRARVFHSEAKLVKALKRPDLEVGPPPRNVAAAGRLNARGISMFYGAESPDTALAEVRPPVGSRVVVARFEITKNLKLLDVEALRSVFVKGSIFDPEYLIRLKRAVFLGHLSDRITMPVMPDDEPFEYLITQAIADYLANRVRLDGLIYKSVQVGGLKSNVALFHRSAGVERLEISKQSELTASLGHWTEDGFEEDYTVFQKDLSPDSSPVEPKGPLSFPSIEDFIDSNESVWPVSSLRIDLSNVRVHRVSAVQFTSHASPVSRYDTL